MLLGETNINGITSFLFVVDDKLTGYQIKGWHKYPLEASVFNELKKLQLSDNNKIIEENGYKVILDLDTGYKHYFKDNQEDLAMFYEMNGVDETLYQGKGKANLRRKIGTTIFLSFEAFVLCINLYYMMSKKNSEDATYQKTEIIYINRESNLFTDKNEILPLSSEEISEYIKSSTRLNEEEKDFLNNELLFADLLPYINKNPKLIEKLRYTLHDIDIQQEDLMIDVTGYAGYNIGANTIYVIGYREDLFYIFKRTVAHEFCHDFQCDSSQFNYLSEAIDDLLASEYFEGISPSNGEDVKILKCLMEIVGVEPILENHLCENASCLYDLLIPYLTKEEIDLFSLNNRLIDNTDEENTNRFEQLKKVLEKLYYGIYGESMANNSMISSILNDLEYERYYFNSEKIKNTEMYASLFDHVEEYTIEQAISLGLIHPYIKRPESVSLDEWLSYEGEEYIGYESKMEKSLVWDKYFKAKKDDGHYICIPIKEAVEKGYLIVDLYQIVYHDKTSDLTNPNIQYEMEKNCGLDTDNNLVYVIKYEKEYFPPIQKSVNVLN